MGLKPKDQTMLNSLINDEISKIPGLVRNIRLPEFRNLFQINDEAEYLYGYTHGSIIGKFDTYYFIAHSGKKPSSAEVDEIAQTILKKTLEIRDTVVKSIGQ